MSAIVKHGQGIYGSETQNRRLVDSRRVDWRAHHVLSSNRGSRQHDAVAAGRTAPSVIPCAVYCVAIIVSPLPTQTVSV